tara:strand:- start:541 stop:909 length:369 start_codon:yes stop_codon:yes gene_type:complete
MARQLTDAGIAGVRKSYAVKQKYRCPICKGSLAVGVQALDHCHSTGHVRGTLCQSCNVSEGKTKAAVLFRTPKTNLAYKDSVEWLRNLADYLEYHKANPSGIIHPSFDVKTGKQKPVKRKKK